MKRCLKNLVEWSDKVQDKLEAFPGKKLRIIALIVACVVAIGVFLSMDLIPATSADYEPLEKQMVLIQQNPEMLLKEDYTCSISNGVIEVEFENEECKLIVKYDQDFNILSVSKVDNRIHWVIAVVLASLIGFMVAYLILGIILLSVELFILLVIVISKLYKKDLAS